MTWNKEDRSFKTLINKETTDSVGKFFFNELGARTLNVHSSEIWSDDIPFNNPAQAVIDGVAEQKTLFVLTEDLTVPNNQSWKAESPPGTRLADWISDKYGADYTVHLFDNTGSEIFTTDPVGWFFDYQTGILTFSGNAAGKARPFKITGYRYIGAKGGGGGGGGGTRIYSTELGLLADAPSAGTIGYAQDTEKFFLRHFLVWQPIPKSFILSRVGGTYTIIVDPVVGDDGDWNDGTITPLKTFQAALLRLPISNQTSFRAGALSARILLKAGNHIVDTSTDVFSSADLGNLRIEGEVATDASFVIDSVTGGVHVWQPPGNPAWTLDEHVGKLLILAVDFGPPYGIYEFNYWIIGNGTHDLTVACQSYAPTYYLLAGATVSIKRLVTKFSTSDGLAISAANMDGYSGGFFFVDFDPTLVPSPLYGGMFSITNGGVSFNNCIVRGNGNPYYNQVNTNSPGATVTAVNCCYISVLGAFSAYGGNIVATDVTAINSSGVFKCRTNCSTLLLTGIMFLRNTNNVVFGAGGITARWYYCDNLYCDSSDIIWGLNWDGQGSHVVLEARDIIIPDPTKIPTNYYVLLGSDVQVILHQWGTKDGVGFEALNPNTTFYVDSTLFPWGTPGTPSVGFSYATLMQQYGGDYDFGWGTRIIVSRSTNF